MRPVYIYALCEPGTRKVRYIGASVNLRKRKWSHVNTSVKLPSLLGDWLRSLSGKAPNMVKLCETSEAFWQDDETRYIRSARALGMPLVNATDGGEGDVNPSPQTRAKKKISNAKVWEDPAYRAHQIARMTTPEAKERSRVRMEAAWKDPEYKTKVLAAQQEARNNPEDSRKKSDAAKARWADPEKRAAVMAARMTPKARVNQSAAATAREARKKSRNSVISKHL